jgi:hypothetical protein
MSVITQAEAQTRSVEIRDEVVVNANTATRVGQLLRDIVDSVAFGAGATGPAGPSAAIKYAFDNSTTTTADPGTGDFRLNNGTLASVTAIAFADTDSNGGNNEAYLLAQDDSTTTAHRGYVIIRKLSAPSTFAIYEITGASTDSAGWVQFVVTHRASNGTFTAADACAVEFFRTGDTGATGPAGPSGVASIVTEATTARTLVIGDAGACVRCTNAAATTVTVPPNASVAFDVGEEILIRQAGAGAVTLAPGAGVTLNTPETLTTLRQHATLRIVKVGTNEWDVSGDFTSQNGTRIATGTLGTALPDSDTTISVAGGSVYELLALSANHSVGLAVTGAVNRQIISIRRLTAANFTYAVNDHNGNPIFVFPALAKGIADLYFDDVTSHRFELAGYMPLS